MFESRSAAANAAASERHGTVWFERLSDGRRVRVRKLVWRLWGFLFGPFGMFVAGLWLNGLVCLVLCVAIAAATIAYLPDWVSHLIFPIGAVWGLLIPELLERKYLRSGWRKVPQGEAATAAGAKPLTLAASEIMQPAAAGGPPTTAHFTPLRSSRWKEVPSWLAAAVIAALVLWGYFRLTERKVSAPAATATTQASEGTHSSSVAPSDCAEVTDFAAKLTRDSAFPRRIQGSLINKCDHPTRLIAITFSLYDQSGAVVGDSADAVENLGAGERWKFDLPIREEAAKDYKLTKVEVYD